MYLLNFKQTVMHIRFVYGEEIFGYNSIALHFVPLKIKSSNIYTMFFCQYLSLK